MQQFDGDQKKEKLIEVWEDIVSIKDLSLALIICPLVTMIGYFIAPNHGSFPLFFGLGGALVGFVIASFFIKPKRIFQQEDKDEDKWI